MPGRKMAGDGEKMQQGVFSAPGIHGAPGSEL